MEYPWDEFNLFVGFRLIPQRYFIVCGPIKVVRGLFAQHPLRSLLVVRDIVQILIHFTYLLNKNFALRSLNYIVPYDDTNNDGTTQNYEFNQRLGLIIKEKNFTLIPYGKIVHHDKNGPKQNDNSHFGIVGQVEIAKDLTFSYDYREENTNGAKLAGTVYGDVVTDMRLMKKNVFFINSMPVHFKLGQADGKNFRRSTVVKATMDITKKIDLSIKHVDNQGKGLFKNNVAQNRNYLVMDIGYKF